MLVGIGIFLLCLFPLRALLNYHEESHLFRWTTYYFREQMASWQGIQEYVASFIVQFFYVAALGSLILAVMVMAFQRLTWWLLKRVGRWKVPLYLLSFLPALGLFFYCFIPKEYLNNEQFREIVTYDYLERTHQWEAILKQTKSDPPKTECGIWCTNYALAMTGCLDQMESYPQCGPQGLLNDAMQKPSFSLYSMSDIYFLLLSAMKRDVPPSVSSQTGMIGIGWASSGGEATALLNDSYLSADGIENCIQVLESIENGNIPQLEFVELNACIGGCVGGVMTIENPFIAKTRLQTVRRYLPVSRNFLSADESFIPPEYVTDDMPEYKPITRLSDSMSESMRMMAQIQRLKETLPGIDCGACGSPTCRAFAEDTVRGLVHGDRCCVVLKNAGTKTEDAAHDGE